MRKRAKVDRNHAAIVDAARRMGASVVSLAGVGHGCPDLLVGLFTRDRQGVCVLVEVKDGSQPASKRQLTPAQRLWRDNWRGRPVATVESEAEMVALLQRVKGA